MANQPSLIPSAWAANNSTTETIPATTSESGKASWDQGFPVETSLPLSEGGIPPKYGDFNGILNVLSQFCLFAQSGGQFTWSSTLSYSVGSIVVGSDGSIYRAVQATTNVNPVGDTSGKWERIVSQSDITALESDIQTAMTNAENAVSNASAAQSAVTTLDANVVKLSGNQTVGGTKTFTSEPIVYTASPNMTFKSSDLIQASNPSANRYVYPIRFMDKNGDFLGYLEFLVGSGGNRRVGIATYKQDGTATYLRLGFDTGGTPYITWNDKTIINGSDNQTVGGKKTFTSPIVITTTSGNATEAISASTNTGAIHINGGAGEGKGAFISLCGQDTVNDNGTFYICAKDGVNTQKNLKGKTDGTLTWAGKGFVYTSDDQTINGGLIIKGTNTTQGIIIERGNPYLVFVETDWSKGTPQSSGISYQGIQFEGSDKAAGAAFFYHYGQDKNSFLEFLVNKMSASTDTASANLIFQYPADNNVMLRPGTNNLVALGASGYRWKEIWCNQSSINTSSDERIKQQIGNIPDAVLDAWDDVDWIQFKYNDSVEEKGADKARLHNGLIAQRVDDAFKTHGLDASKYGLFLYDKWEGSEEVKDDSGKIVVQAQPAGDAYGLRYTEALCMEAAYQRRRADRAEARISALERRLNEMEAVLASLLSPVGDETYAEPEQEQDAEQENGDEISA